MNDNEFKTKVSVELDTTKAEQQLKELGDKKVKLDVDTGNTEKNINKVDKSINTAQKSANSFGSTLKKSLDIGTAAAITAKGFQLINKAARDAVEAVKDFDGAIKDLRMATGESYESVQKLVQGYNEMGKAIGATTTEITDAANSWLRQGHSIADTNTLIRDSMILAKVGQLDSADATEYLTSAMKGYKVSVQDVIEIVNKLTAVDLVSATDAGGLAEGMARVAVSADMAGVSMDRLLAYLAVTGEVTQRSMSTVGESFKTIFARMSDIKADKLELIDEDGTTELLSDVELTLKNVDIDLRKTVHEYENYGDVLDNLAAKWSFLNKDQQNALAKAFAGTRQANNFRVLMENYDKVSKYMDVAANSAGTAEQKFNAYLDSIEAKTKSLQATFESLAVNSFSTEMYGGIIEATTAVIEFLDKTNLLKGSLAGLAAAGAIKLFVGLATGISNAAVKLNEFNAALKMVKAGNIGENEIAQLAKMTANLSQSQLKAVLSSKALSNEQRVAILTAQGMSQAEAQAALASMGLATAEGTATTATFSLSGALKGLWTTLKANPLILVASAVSAAVMAFSAYEQHIEEVKQATLDRINQIEEESKQLSSLIQKYKELAAADTTDSGTREKIKNIQDEITSLVGSQADNLDLVNGKLDEELAKLQSISKQQLKNDIATYRDAYNNAKEDTRNKSTMHEGFWMDNIFGGSDYLIDYNILPQDENLKNSVQNIIKEVIESKYGEVWNGYGSYSFNFSKVGDNDFQSRIDAVSEILNRLQKLDGYDTNSTLFSKLTAFRNELQDVYNDQVEQGNNLMNALITDFDNSNRDDISSFDDYMSYRNEIIGKIKKDSTISEMMSDGVFDSESITKSVDNYLGTLEDFSEYYNQWYEKFGSDAVKGINEIKKKYQMVIGSDSNNVDNPDNAPIDFLNGKFPEISFPNLTENAQKQVDKFNQWIDGLSQEDKEIVYQISCDTDTANYTLEEWKNALENYEVPEVNKITFSDLMETGFSDSVDEYIETVNELQSALSKFRDGDFGNEDFIELVKNFPELADNANNLDSAIITLLGDMNSDIADKFASQFGNMDTDEDIQALQNFQDAVLALGEVVSNTEFAVNIEAETEGMDNLWTSIKESVSSTGLTAESIKNLRARYQDLEDYDAAKLFEKTANGIHLNTKALRELESAYEKQEKANLKNTLDDLIEQYNDLTLEMDNCANASERDTLYGQRDNILQQINDTADLISQYDALTSSYNAWQEAQSATDQRDMYSNLASGYESIKKLIDQGWYNDSEVNTYLDTMLNASQRTKDNYADFQKLTEQIEGTSFSIADFFKYDEDNNLVTDGLFDFFDTVKAKLGDDFVQITEDGDYAWDFTGDKVKKVADALGMSTEAVEILEKAMGDVTENTNLDSFVANLDGLAEGMSDRVESLKKALGGKSEDYDLGSFNFGSFDTKDLETQISNIKSVIDGEFKDSDGKIDLSIDGADEAVSILASLVARKQDLEKPTIMKVDTDKLDGKAQEVVTKLQDLKGQFNQIELNKTIGVDTTEAQQKIQDIVTALDSYDGKGELGLDTQEAQSAIEEIKNAKPDVNGKLNISQESLDTVENVINGIKPEVLVKLGVKAEFIDEYDPDDKTKKVTYLLESKEVDKYDPKNHKRTVTYSLIKTSDLREFNPKDITRTVTYDIKTNGSVPSKAQGTAYANGNWGTKDSGVALGGEIGQELVVRNGRFFTIGDDGAEFFAYKKGDIIFNAEQTRQILANGKITNGKKRGVAYLEGTAFGSGSNANRRRSSGSSHSVSSSGSSKSSSSNSSSKSSNNSSDDKEPEVFNWIEIAINRIERAISNLGRKAESTFKKLSTRISSTNKEISKVNEEINLQQKAADRYMKQAKSVGLSSSLAKKVQDGTIDINEYDEDTQKLINDYKEWYEKSLDCKDAIEELHESLAQLYEDNFNNTQTDYENQLSLIEHLANTYNNGLDLLETKGYLASTKYYAALKDAEKQNINVLNNELADLEKRFSEAMNSGEIEKYSEAWYSMQTTINGVKEAIDEANISLAEYAKTMRELEWSYFDYAQDRIAQITQEADFLINLMSNSDLYDDKGQLNNTGMATMGLHGQNYNVYMAQADQYAEELLAINKELTKDPYNTDLIARREELLGLQQDSIEAAEKEKQAIVDMVEEGINLELAALKDLIDTYTDALDSAKNLYDYQKKVKDKTSEIASLEKQFMAYKNDISEETRATVQKLKVELENAKEDLQETEYEQFISDQKKLLDDLYTQYEEIINQRLDNVDALIGDMIDVVNANTETINRTLTDTADSVGYTLSDNLRQIWDGSTSALDGTIAKYGDDFSAQFTSVNTILSNIETLIRSMVNKSNETATSKVNDTKTTTAPKTSVKTETKKNTSNKSNEKKITVGGKINAKGAKIYANSYGGGASTQYFASDPIYTVLGENNGYYKVRWHKASSGVTGWFKKGDVKAYKTGGLVDFTGLAQLDGTPGKPELVLNAEDTKNFLELKDVLSKMKSQKLSIIGQPENMNTYGIDTSPQIGNMPNIHSRLAEFEKPTIQQTNTVNLGGINIDHVQDYNDFVRQLQQDKQFDNMIVDMTIGRINGGSSLAKYKYKFNK
ncbi:MAG: phage tail tape measure protein [Ruminococcus sp.]|nr:phage tail tape measure protein [Ruminococcus sp.]